MEDLSAKIVEDYIFSIVLRLYRKTFGYKPGILHTGPRTRPYRATVSYENEKDAKRTAVNVLFNDLMVKIEVSHSKLVKTCQTTHEWDGTESIKHVRSWHNLRLWEDKFNVADPASKGGINKFLSETFRSIKRERLM